jgi:cell division protein ZapA (FtsZ GTPase activity inhibitor)
MDTPFMVIISMKALKMDSQMILTTAQVTIMTAMAITIMLTMSTLVETIIGQNIDLDQVIAGLEIFQRYLTFGSQEEKVNR